jgi:hypothetical protein
MLGGGAGGGEGGGLGGGLGGGGLGGGGGGGEGGGGLGGGHGGSARVCAGRRLGGGMSGLLRRMLRRLPGELRATSKACAGRQTASTSRPGRSCRAAGPAQQAPPTLLLLPSARPAGGPTVLHADERVAIA